MKPCYLPLFVVIVCLLLTGCNSRPENMATAQPIGPTPTLNAIGPCYGGFYGHGVVGDGSRKGVEYNGTTYYSVGAVRADAILADQLTPTHLVLTDPQEGHVEEAEKGCRIFSIAGHELTQTFAIKLPNPLFPAYCVRTGYEYLPYVRRGIPAPDLPINYKLGDPSSSPVPLDLSVQGLLDAGWPRIDWNRPVIYEGKTYDTISKRDHQADFGEISKDALVLVETLVVTAPPEKRLPEDFGPLELTEEVTDHIRIYTVKGLGTDVLIVDGCPCDRAVDSFIFYQPTQ